MAIAYKEFDQVSGTIVAGLKQAILASSDWAHLQLTTGTQNTTLSSGASPGATSISTAATIPSGSYITIGNGAANPEVRLTTAVSGAGPFTVSFSATEPLTGTYSSSAAVGVGSYMKATTTRGAQMVIDLAGTAPDTLAVKPIVYQSHDGTTAGLSAQRYIIFKRNTGATTNVIHARVSAHKDGLYIDVEGPRASETGADSSTAGSYRSPFYLGDIYPYDAADTTPVVVLAAGAATAIPDQTLYVKVSRNRDNVQSWVTANLRTLAYPDYLSSLSASTVNPVARNGDFVESPWVVFEQVDGMRGRVTYLHFGGFSGFVTADEPSPVALGTEMIYGSFKYRAFAPFHTDSNNVHCYAFACMNNGNSTNYWFSPILWVPVAAYP